MHFSGGFTRHLYQLLIQELKRAVVHSIQAASLGTVNVAIKEAQEPSPRPRWCLFPHVQTGVISAVLFRWLKWLWSPRHRLSWLLFSESSLTKDLDRRGAFTTTTSGLAARRRPRPCRELCSRSSVREAGRPARRPRGRSP